MRRFCMATALIATLVLALGGTSAFGQTLPDPETPYLFRTEGLPLSGPYDVAQLIDVFPPGATTAWHTHPGLVLVTVIEGELTLRIDGAEKVYKTGESFVELPDQVRQATNATTVPMRLLVTIVVPKGAPLSMPQHEDSTPPPHPETPYLFRTEGLPLSGPYDVAQLIDVFPPGATTAWHTHPGLVLVTVIEGELTLRIDGAEKVYKTGESFVELPDQVRQATNRSRARTSLMVSIVLLRGAPLSVPHATPPQLPDTGVEGAPVTFPETGFSLEGDFLAYWQAQGALPVFGMPIASARQVDGQISQWLERARFELHPEHSAPYNVLLGRLGVEVLTRQGRDWTTFAKASPDAAHYFLETGHAIAPEFWGYWHTHGLEFGDAGVTVRESVALFGYPISQAHTETNTSGDRVLTQWFERARLELHPGIGAVPRVLLGRLGAEAHHGTGGR